MAMLMSMNRCMRPCNPRQTTQVSRFVAIEVTANAMVGTVEYSVGVF
jgi:hypothetical protein